jgi:hypothetical protein
MSDMEFVWNKFLASVIEELFTNRIIIGEEI